ncbi:hypothetical protein [Lutibacter agarilyticus]|uniref:hypothetical protein n=1 Tax=Lutibacter agarilyticus TaxID=1109740 RepID=UPI001595502D|nr:hypothetical protein [Lutibacter agarilyticus]
MKRLYKIIVLFVIIFIVGIFLSIKTINSSFSSEDHIETVSLPSTALKLSIQL